MHPFEHNSRINWICWYSYPSNEYPLWLPHNNQLFIRNCISSGSLHTGDFSQKAHIYLASRYLWGRGHSCALFGGKNEHQSQYPQTDLRMIYLIVENWAEPWGNLTIIHVGSRKYQDANYLKLMRVKCLGKVSGVSRTVSSLIDWFTCPRRVPPTIHSVFASPF